MSRIFRLNTTLISLMISTCTFSASQFTGPYVGVGAGWLQARGNINESALVTSPLFTLMLPASLTSSNYQTGNKTANTIVGSLSLGYNYQVKDSIFLAGEASISALPSKMLSISNTTGIANSVGFGPSINAGYLSSQTDVNLSNLQYALDLRPGFVSRFEALFYGRIGVGFTRVNLNNNNLLDTGIPAGFATLATQFNLPVSTHKYMNGLRLGLGAEKHLNKQFSVFVDYVHTNYGRISLNGIRTASVLSVPFFNSYTVPSSTFTSQASASLSTNQLEFGARYYFG